MTDFNSQACFDKLTTHELSVNFTREPIIETIISPKEGYKLVLRSSKMSSLEEISVDAVEIVSFGQALFYRSLEKSKCFLLPVSDYEVMEVRETRMVLKNASFEKNIKIGGGREHVKSTKEILPEKTEEGASLDEEALAPEEISEPVAPYAETRMDRKRDRRRNRRKRGHEERLGDSHERHEHKAPPAEELNQLADEAETPKETKPVPVFAGLIPPPPTLISETIARYKERGDVLEKPKPSNPHASHEEAHHASVQLEEPAQEEPFEE